MARVSVSASTIACVFLLLPVTVELLGVGARALDHRARHSCGQERDEGDTEHELDASDEPADMGRRDDVAIADGGDGLQRPPEREAQRREVVLVDDADRRPLRRARAGRTSSARPNVTERALTIFCMRRSMSDSDAGGHPVGFNAQRRFPSRYG